MIINLKYKKGYKVEDNYYCVNKYEIKDNCLYIYKPLNTVVIPLNNIIKFIVH